MESNAMDVIPIRQVFKSIVEGRAVIRLTAENVFYNPVQEFNRDLSIAVLNAFVQDFKGEKIAEIGNRRTSVDSELLGEDEKQVDITILEALSASGLRSIRYAKEVPHVTKIIANDISQQAIETIKDNVVFNNVDHIVETSHDDACMLMYKHRHRKKRFSAVDLDPYGSPSVFLDAAVQSVADGGLLLVTATDMAVLAGNSPETCYNKYGAISLRTKSCHEMALRILLQSIESHANRYTRYIVPMLSVSADFYIRVFVKVYSGASKCKKTTSKLSMVYHCPGCDTMALQPLSTFKPNPTDDQPDRVKSVLPPAPAVAQKCDNCNQKYQMGGPIWSAPLHAEEFVSRVQELVQASPSQFGTARRMDGMLSVVLEELPHAPLYYTLDRLCGTVHSGMIPIMLFRSAILNAGYDVSYSHANKLSIKTNAPSRLIWDILRTWVTIQPVKPAKIEANPIAKHVLSQAITYDVNLTERKDANPESRRERHTRYQFNPTRHWGPGCRSTINTAEVKDRKAKQNQNKRKTKSDSFNKRRFSPQHDLDGPKKKVPQQPLIITTTASDSDDDIVPECEPSARAEEPATAVPTTKDNEVATQPVGDDAAMQPDAQGGASETLPDTTK